MLHLGCGRAFSEPMVISKYLWRGSALICYMCFLYLIVRGFGHKFFKKKKTVKVKVADVVQQ